MIIPNENNWIQVNGSDIEGSVDYSRNINLDDRGYVKLSNRLVAIKSENGDTNFDLPVSYGYSSASSFFITTTDQPYTLTYDGQITVAEDVVANNPSGSIYGDGISWQDRWYVTGSSSFTYKAYSGGAWTSVTLSPALTSSNPHPMCVFENRQTLVIGNVNEVKQIDTSHADTTNLTLPAGQQVSRIVYNRNLVAITTQSTYSDVTVPGYFYIWDGSTTTANLGIPFGSCQDIGLIAYGASFVILNSIGQLLEYNGSGFNVLGNLPIYYDDNAYGTNKQTRGRTMSVRGDNIYINIPTNSSGSSFRNARGERYDEKSPSGIWCYNPKYGLYQTYSNSSALAFTKTFGTSGVDTATDIITVTATVPPTGTPCKYYDGGGTILAGLNIRITYYVIKLSSTTFKLATTKTNALASTAINLTGTGSAFQSVTFFPEYDFGQSSSTRTGGITSLIDIYKTTSNIGNNFLSAADLQDTTLTDYATMSMGIDDIENRGFIVTPKIYSEGVTDMFQSVYIYFDKPVKDIDKIVLKYRNSDFAAVNQPAYINRQTPVCTWTSSTVFTTTDDFSTVVAGYEVDIVSGSGAGQMAHISSITESSGTYTVTLDEAILGITANDSSYVSINNWTKLGVITYTDSNPNNFKEFTIGKPSTWIQFKVEMRGVDIRVHKLDVIKKPHQQR